MIPSFQKFPLRTKFLSFRRHASLAQTPHFRIYFSPSRTSSLAVIVSKKSFKLASSRNWLKRLVYDHAWELVKTKNLSCVVLLKPIPLQKGPATQALLISELNCLNSI